MLQVRTNLGEINATYNKVKQSNNKKWLNDQQREGPKIREKKRSTWVIEWSVLMDPFRALCKDDHLSTCAGISYLAESLILGGNFIPGCRGISIFNFFWVFTKLIYALWGKRNIQFFRVVGSKWLWIWKMSNLKDLSLIIQLLFSSDLAFQLGFYIPKHNQTKCCIFRRHFLATT